MTSRNAQHERLGAGNAHAKTVQTSRPERIDTSGQTLSSNSSDGARAQPQLLSYQELDMINNRLLSAGESIEISRQKLFETRFVASSALQDIEQERQVRQRCSDAYKEIHAQHERNVAEMHGMTSKCVSLHKELEKSQQLVFNYGSAIEELKHRAAENAIKIGELERQRIEAAKQMQFVIDRDSSARKRIDELKQEKTDLMQEHRAAISMRVARESLAEQRIDELQEGVDALIQEHQAAMKVTIDRMNSAEQKVREFREFTSTTEHPELASTCLTTPEQSRESVKRPRLETKKQSGRPSKHRKCKEATSMEEDDTIWVRMR